MNETIKLVFYDKEYDKQLESFELEHAQERFTAYPHQILETLVDTERHYVLMVQEESVIGYFVLHENKGPVDIGSHNRALLIRALAVSKKEQGKGYALSAMKILPGFAKEYFKNAEELVLVVNHANIPAQNLYKKAGFSDTGLRRNGVHGLQFIYNYSLT
jgi:RimJ/RimL family protein N-acetyltransferase